MGLAFDKLDVEGVAILLAGIKDGGIMRWSKEALQVVAKLPLGDSLDEKLHMVSYIFGIIDDLMIEPRLNVSQSGCMEAFRMNASAEQSWRHQPAQSFELLCGPVAALEHAHLRQTSKQ